VKIMIVAALLLSLTRITAGQNQALAFEVASVRASVPGRTITQAGDMTASFSPDRFTGKNLRLLDLIDIAYRVQTWQVSGGPNWVDPGNTTSDRYDILAKAEHKTNPDELRLMLQTLLADRFKLTLHRDTKLGQTYELSIGKNGHKLEKLTTDDYERSDGTYSPGRLVANHMTMSDLSLGLMGFLETPVTDKTGLKGFFKFTLVWTPDAFRSRGGEARINGERIDTNVPSLFTALQEQLGLKLESTKGHVEVLVIDHVERPSEN